ncbi:MAG: radical SAM protein [Bacteroidota bacterium]
MSQDNIKSISAKTLIGRIKNGPEPWFGTSYNLNLYRGCQHGCIYCDSRSKCYRIENFSEILVKENALELMDKELSSFRKKGTIGFGSMNDCYMPIEKEREMTRGALELALKHKFPVHIITKGDLVVRDIDLLKKISKIYAAVSFTITAADDKLSKKIEPGAPPTSARLAAMKQLSDAGIYTGVTMMPILPSITDSPENIKSIVSLAASSGAKYILAAMGLTMRDGQREYMYDKFDQLFPGLKTQYKKRYGLKYQCNVPDADLLYATFVQACKKHKIKTRMDFFHGEQQEQLSLF